MNRRRMLRSMMACLLAVVVTAGSVPTELFTANYGDLMKVHFVRLSPMGNLSPE